MHWALPNIKKVWSSLGEKPMDRGAKYFYYQSARTSYSGTEKARIPELTVGTVPKWSFGLEMEHGRMQSKVIKFL
jgi:hypothetical protein